jgi:hypothetical protein
VTHTIALGFQTAIKQASAEMRREALGEWNRHADFIYAVFIAYENVAQYSP